MANLQLQNFTTAVQNMAAAMQASASWALDLTAGSVIRAILEASASVVLWLQWLILQVLALTRAATSNGSDLDSWYADFGFVRLPAVLASGAVTFGRYTNTQAALIPAGATVKTLDGQQTFTVTADPTNAAWSASLNGYTIPANVTSVTVPVAVVNTGSGMLGNIMAASIGLIASAIPAVDTVTNALAFNNGVGAESDSAFRTRFQLFLNSLAEATVAAAEYAVSQVQQGLTFTVQPNWNGTIYTPGTYVVTFDDGSGAAPSPLVASVTAAVQAVRPIGSTAIVQAATAVLANVSLTIVCATTALHAAAVGPAAAAITAFIQALPVGATMPYGRLWQLAFDASPSITGVNSVLLDGGTADLTVTQAQVVRAGTVAVD